MPPPPAKPATQRRRNRKRKRRAASSSSSSSSSDSSDSSDDGRTTKPTIVTKPPPAASSESESDSDSDSSSSSSSSSSSDDEAPSKMRGRITAPAASKSVDPETMKPVRRRLSPSPSPPPTNLPTFLPSEESVSHEASKVNEQDLKDRFKQFWMSSVADGFQADLETIRTEPNLGTSRLALLIDSLASGADVFSSSRNGTDVNEMEVVLN
ncbi:hypothetical protein BJ165DRAFT_1416338 [Panaeolus papilionaceus]|nr:hypothetical protein BJ165DRAFT_1416338 [Panaeolus papilionaceus]